MSVFFNLLITGFLIMQPSPTIPSSWNAGILVVDLASENTLVSINSEIAFRPASTVKAVTTLSALSSLGSAHVYHTSIKVDTTTNSIFLVGSGAPLLSIEDVTRAAMETVALLPTRNNWNLYLDPSAIAGETHLPGWSSSDWNRTYCPPVEPLCIGDNILEIVVASINGNIRLFTYPPLPGLNLFRNNLSTGQTTAITAIGGNWETGLPEMIISGTIRNNSREILYKPFAGAPGELVMVLQDELIDWGITVSYNGIRDASTSDNLLTTAIMYSDPLWMILGSMNKWSRNIVAEQILRTIANEVTGQPGSTRAGCDISGALLTDLSPNSESSNWQLADGSGLSRLNLLTPAQLVAVFVAGAESLEFGPEFLASFPVNGVDGTLSRRMSDLPAGSFRGKTGSLNDTCTIAGILTSQSGRKLALAIFLEFPQGQIWRARAWQDNYIESLYWAL